MESNIWIRCAVGLIAASVSKKASNPPALLNRSNRFHTVFQFPYSLGSARQRTFSTVKKCSASKNRRSSAALRPRRGKHARNTSKVCAQSSSLIFVDIVPTPSVSRNPMNHLRFNLGIGKSHLSTIRPHGLGENFRVSFQGAVLVGKFDLEGHEARSMLKAPLNPNGFPNSDVLYQAAVSLTHVGDSQEAESLNL